VIKELKQGPANANTRESDGPGPMMVLTEPTIKLGPTTIHDK
jgi:hypothetical protein